jgi:hypothetical protein
MEWYYYQYRVVYGTRTARVLATGLIEEWIYIFSGTRVSWESIHSNIDRVLDSEMYRLSPSPR